MLLQTAPSAEGFSTGAAWKRALARVNSHVNCQMAFLTVTFPTHRTREGLLTGVSSDMISQMTSVAVTFPTGLARKRSVARVASHVQR